MRVIVAGVGYPDLCDYSIGVDVIERLAGWDAPANIVVEDLSYNPIAVMQRFEDEPPDDRFGRAIFISAVKRGSRAPGTVSCYRWDGVLPSADEIQAAVTEGVTGIIALENTLVVAGHFRALPPEVVVVEVEPETHEFGATLSDAVAAAFDRICTLVKALATDDTTVASLPVQRMEFASPPGMRIQ